MFEPFEFEFMIRAMVAASVVGALTAAVGVFVVLRGLSYIGHGLAHSVFGGAVVSFVAGINFYIGATVWGLVSVFLINAVSRRRQIGGDAAIGIITTSAFAVGVLLISRGGSFNRDFEAALFGEILGITNTDLAISAAVLVVVMLALFLMWKQLIFTTFDQDVAGAYGVPVRAVEGVFSLILAASVIASLQVLGVTLLAAALVIPPVGARLLTDSFTRMFFIAVALGTLTGFFGAYMSWFVDSSSGATIVLLQAAVFVLALSYAGARSRWLRRGARETERIAGLEKTVY